MSIAYKEACARIEALALFPKKNSLDHTKECLRRLGSPDRAFRCIHVAGTNGKGSVCAYLTSVFEKAGMRCGLFISPHLISMTERIQVDGHPVSERTFAGLYVKVKAMSDQLALEGMETPSYFEFIFLMAMLAFAEAGVEVVVLETGLGGRLDATNAVVSPYLTILTNIALDHTKFLGSTIPEVAGEKAGIIKPGIPVVFDAHTREAEPVIRRTAEEKVCISNGVYDEDYEITAIDRQGLEMRTKDTGSRPIWLPFPAPYEAANAAVAVRSCRILRETYPKTFGGITDTIVAAGLRDTRWEGRMEIVKEGIYFDGAHNMDGMMAFLDAASLIEGKNEVSILFGAASDKAYPAMIRALTERLVIANVVVTEIESERAVPAGELKRLFEEAGISKVDAVGNPAEAFELACRRKGERDLFCIGSLYLVGSLKKYVEAHKHI